MNPENFFELIDSETDSFDSSDDSENDPSFDIIEETRSKLSALSIKKKPKSRVAVEVDEDADVAEVAAPEFDADDQKSYEVVEKMIECGQVEKLKVEQCKLYLRKHGLRLTGKKDVLINRIKEHVSIVNGEGECKYPASSFVMNCKGDACTGDVVMFEQNVYEMFNIASRSATGPPCGKRVVAGRIVKESYGAAKQQHTFTIEVLWSKGVKSLPPLHPLLIKGRNLYRLKTTRQRWEDENERQIILSEKHDRGNEARSKRDTRLQEKGRRKALRESRASKGNTQNKKQEKKRAASPTRPMIDSRNPNTLIRPEVAPSNPHAGASTLTSMNHNHHGHSYKENIAPKTTRGPAVNVERVASFRKTSEVKQNLGSYPSRTYERDEYDRTANIYYHHQGPPKSYSVKQGNKNGHDFDYRASIHQGPPQNYSSRQGYKSDHEYARRASIFHPQSPQRYSSQQVYKGGHEYDRGASIFYPQSPQRYASRPGNKYDYDGRVSIGHPQSLTQRYGTQPGGYRYQGQKQQPCKHYAQGRCYYGTDCNYLH
ncbi:zinc finger CCCH domain-containing protein 62-like protein [Tanacetum coccineum]|uniref:Zinc finger CCCH domain-containing protein 62-like protein n=1 Tax=Tanacetum coccineum TaxID=301880 RepID=A0ABQ5F8D6_9ASTR